MTADSTPVQGHFDGYRNGSFFGWARYADAPDTPVVIQIVANGLLIAEAEASVYRPDLRAAGIGHGRYGFAIAAEVYVEQRGPVRVVVRAKDGEILIDGEAEIGGEPVLEEHEKSTFEAFVAAVLGEAADRDAPPAAEQRPKINFIAYAAAGRDARADALGAPEYSYGFVLQAFAPLLEAMGSLHMVADPAREVDPLYEAQLARGETSLFLSFAPPHRTVLGLRCPTIPVIAWEFPTIPSAIWDDEARHDWRRVLRQTGRAITLSSFAARAVKATMGPDFPVIGAPAPVWDRRPDLHDAPFRAFDVAATVRVQGFVFDTAGRTFPMGMATPAPPPTMELPQQVDLAGVVFTSVFSPKDGRKNWNDLVNAFIIGLGDTPDATLVLKMVGADTSYWWWEMYDAFIKAPPFACRIVVLHGFLDDDGYGDLIRATHWVANASKAEGQCLPLVEYMAAGRPAVAPRNTAMLDYIDPACALVVDSDEEYCGWPHDPRQELVTSRHRVSWASLRDSLREAYRISKSDPARFTAMSAAAKATVRAYCSDATVSDRLDGFLGLGLRPRDAGAISPMLSAHAA